MPWVLVVLDEAHRLRNVYKSSNVIANTLKLALSGKHKLLLTATPLQNSLLELFGLVSFIDEHTFGDLKSFREQFANLNQEQVFQTLKARLKPVCHRTLRRQVTAYIPYTKRLPLVEEFTPEESEDRQMLGEDVAARLLTLPSASSPRPQGGGWGEGGVTQQLETVTQQRQAAIQRNISERNARFFEEEADKLDDWADDLKVGLEREIKEFDRQIKEARRAATTALTLEEKLAGQKQIKSLEAQRNLKRRTLFDAQDQVDQQREELIAAIESKLNQTVWAEQLFSLRWGLD